jgi:Family of unknown function (DUF6069)
MSSVALSSSAPLETRAVDRGRFALAGLATVVAAVAANVLVYLAGSALVGYDSRFLPLANAGGTVLFTLVPAIVAVLLYALLLRLGGDPARRFTIVAGVALVLSLIPDFTYIPTVAGATAGQTAILVLMHVVAAGVIVGMLTALARPHGR